MPPKVFDQMYDHILTDKGLEIFDKDWAATLGDGQQSTQEFLRILPMYEELDCFEEALKHFGTRVEVICAMELSQRITAEDAYQMIKNELKEVKKVRKLHNK